MNIIITMAGHGKRFFDVGYSQPKYKIECKGKTLFEWSLLSLSDFFDERFYFIVQGKDGAEEFIQKKCSQLGISEYSVHELEKVTRGQAETAMILDYGKISNELLDRQCPIVIYNIDTYVEPGHINQKNIHGDGWIPCFEAEGEHWSFVKINKNGEAVEIKEKERISSLATVGFYYFKSFDLYVELFKKYQKEFKENQSKLKELYVAPLYNYMIQKHQKVFVHLIKDVKVVHPLGTPEEVDIFKNS